MIICKRAFLALTAVLNLSPVFATFSTTDVHTPPHSSLNALPDQMVNALIYTQERACCEAEESAARAPLNAVWNALQQVRRTATTFDRATAASKLTDARLQTALTGAAAAHQDLRLEMAH